MISDERVKELACTIYGKHGPQSLYEIAMVEGAERAIRTAAAEAETAERKACDRLAYSLGSHIIANAIRNRGDKP